MASELLWRLIRSHVNVYIRGTRLERDWPAVQAKGGAKELGQFIADYPSSPRTTAAREMLPVAQAFERAEAVGSPEEYEHFVSTFPTSRWADQARARIPFAALLIACQAADEEEVTKLVEAGKSLDGSSMASVLLWRLMRSHVNVYIRGTRSDTGSIGQPPGPDSRTLSAFRLLLESGADPDYYKIKGFQQAISHRIAPEADLLTSGSPGALVPSELGGMSALEYARLNGLDDFARLLETRGE